MALSIVPQDGYSYVRGVIDSPTELAPLGRREISAKIGPHYIGFDDRFEEPVVVRAYYDPDDGESRLPGLDDRYFKYYYAGYIQFIQVRFRGEPIPPQIYGGHLADRGPYADPRAQQFVDFMGPQQACARVFAFPGQDWTRLDPFFAWNGALLDGTVRDVTDLTRYPRRNGVLYSRPHDRVPAAQRARCASLVGDVAPGLLTAAVIDRLIGVVGDNRGEDDLMAPIPVAAADGREAYEIAWAALTGANGQLAGLTYPEVTGRAIGRYTLVTVPDAEDMPPTLCIWFDVERNGQQRVVRVRSINWHELESTLDAERTRAFHEMYYYTVNQGVPRPSQPGPPAPRGARGLDALPVPVAPTDLQWHYTTCLYAHQQLRHTRNTPRYADIVFLDGLEWTAQQVYDPDERSLRFSLVSDPRRTVAQPREALDAYYAAIEHALTVPPDQRPDIDLSNFTLASMTRHDMGAGQKLNTGAP